MTDFSNKTWRLGIAPDNRRYSKRPGGELPLQFVTVPPSSHHATEGGDPSELDLNPHFNQAVTITVKTGFSLPLGWSLLAGVLAYDGTSGPSSASVTFVATAGGQTLEFTILLKTLAVEPTFDVWAYTDGGLSNIAYQIWDPVLEAWGDWIDGQAGGEGGVVTPLTATQLPGPFEFIDAVGVQPDTIIESNAIAITSEGHLLRLRRRSYALTDQSTVRIAYAVIGTEVSEPWRVITDVTVTEDLPEPTVPDPTGTEHFIALGTSSFNGNTNNVQPGDTITIRSGERGPLTITKVYGTAAKPVLIRNDPNGNGPVIIRRTSPGSGGFVWNNTDVQNVIYDGLFKWQGANPNDLTFGLKVTCIVANDAPSSLMKFGNLYTDITLRGIELDGQWPSVTGRYKGGIGLQCNMSTEPYRAAANPGFWRENCTIEWMKVRNCYGEGMYLGPNHKVTDPEIPLRNWIIRYNDIAYTGRESAQIKSLHGGTIETNRWHNCKHAYAGWLRYSDPDVSEGTLMGAGLSCFEGGNIRIYNNLIIQPRLQGIQNYFQNLPASYGVFVNHIYNNVIYNNGSYPVGANFGHGITCSAGSNRARPQPNIYNNTIIRAGRNGIKIGSVVTSGRVQDNIVCESGWNYSGGEDLSIDGTVDVINNRTGTVASQNFIAPAEPDLNFRLTSTSPARNSGSASGFPATDHDGVSRPQGAAADQGAFEFEE